MSSGIRSAAWPSSRSTGSGRSAAGFHAPSEAGGSCVRAATPAAVSSSRVGRRLTARPTGEPARRAIVAPWSPVERGSRGPDPAWRIESSTRTCTVDIVAPRPRGTIRSPPATTRHIRGGNVASASTTAKRAKASGRPLPILEGLLPIDPARVPTDVIAGATLAALAIPETMGYASMAGMPVVTGLYTIVLPIFLFAIFGSSRHLVVGADSATAVVLAAGLVGMGVVAGSTEYVALAGLAALMVAVVLWRPDPEARLHRQLPVPQRPHRVPDRRRHPGRDGPAARRARCQRRQRHDPREVLDDHPEHPRDEHPDAGRVDRRVGHHPGLRPNQQEDPRRAHRGRRDDPDQLRRAPAEQRDPPRDRPQRAPAVRPAAGRHRLEQHRRTAADRRSRASSSSWPRAPRRRGPMRSSTRTASTRTSTWSG